MDMERKYLMIFLVMLLYLIPANDLSAQYCLSLKYDNNGNRISMSVKNCLQEFRSEETEDEISDYDEKIEELLVYPNPSAGIFDVELDGDNADDEVVFQLFDNKGVLIKNGGFVKRMSFDICNNPAGIYLLRVIKGENVYSRIVVKL